MRAASQEALEGAKARWEAALRQESGREIGLGCELFALADLIRREGALSKALTDTSRSGEDRSSLASAILASKVSAPVEELFAGLVAEKWADERDLAEAIEELGVDAVLARAQATRRLHAVEEELYRASRLLADERDLRIALSDEAIDVERRLELARGVWSGRVGEETLALTERAVRRVDASTLASSLRRYVDAAAALQRRLVASVTVAAPLTRGQEVRLTRTLSARYGTDVSLHVAIDPDVIGGMRIHVGDDVIDATLANRIKGVKDAIKR
ncbi:MAG: F0F1 ATP synthase subunit delta [Actinomycetaceae bacterium]|nr:F0F1 ATP synthase subunit delta [Actinomycetaceae bacterium]